MAAKQIRRRSGIQKILKKPFKEYTTRRAQVTDVDTIQRLFTDNTYKLFGDVNIDDLIHLCYITLVLEDEHGDIVAAICVNNYPNIPSIPPWSWQDWLSSKYRMDRANSRNALWVHLAVYDRHHKYVFMIPLLQALFAKCLYTEFIFFVLPPNIWASLDWLEKLGMDILPAGYLSGKSVQTLYVILRQHYVLNYKIRKAVAEDNDDLVPLINSHAKMLKKMYGEFYIAEVILNREAHEDRHLIVAEYEGEAVAVLCLNRNLNYKIATDCFQLITFYGLRKPHSKDVLYLNAENTQSTNDGDLSMYSFIFVCTEDECVLEPIEQELPENSVIDLNETIDDIILLSDEEEEEEEEEVEFLDFRGHVNLEISYDALEFTEKQLESWRKTKKRCTTVTSSDESDAYFHGSENAFTLEIAAARPEHEPALSSLLEAAFELFPKRDYCVMSIPSQSYSFPLTSKVFVRAAPKPESDFAQELYIVHQSAINADLVVREAYRRDYANIKKFLRRVTKGDSVMREFQSWMDSELDEQRAYVIFCDVHIIGLAIVSELDDLEYLISHYQLATWTDMSKHKLGQSGLIKHFVLSPIFQRHIRFFLLEVHRLSDFSILFYVISPKDCEAVSSKALCCVLGDLIPVIPAKMPEYCNTKTSSWNLPEAVGRVERPYAIYISTPVYCGLTRQEINDKIIVVGASDIGIAFLVGLIFHNDPNIRVTFNNIILVSTHGLVPYRSNRFRDIMTPTTGDVSGYYLSLLSLPTYVTVITGVMSAIDRRNKTILVNGASLNYDMLFLTCGKQYQMPKRSEDKKGSSVERPNNVFIVNTETDIDVIIKTLRDLVEDDLPGWLITRLIGHVVVYGYTLDAYCCLEAIMELGIPNSKIYFMVPHRSSEDPYSHNTIFNDNDVEDAVNANIQDLGIQLHLDYEFVDWTFDAKNHNITSIRFESLTRMLDVDCLCVFMYEKKRISTKTFKAITNANLTFDGGVVVDTNCCTNDPNIYAAGTITKYSRRYYAEHMKQCYFNRTEIGHKLGQQILDKLMRGVSPSSENETIHSNCRQEDKNLVPRYIQPLMVYARLPGKINYMSVKKPGVEIPLDVAMTADDYGQVLTSGDCKNIESQGYFRLHLNNYNTVETITCLTKRELEKVNLTHLWGKHEKLLNNLVTRFEMVTITDLFTFFAEPWSYAVYHDRFDKLNEDINNILTMMTDEDGASIMEDIIEKLSNNKWKKLTPAQFHEQQRNFNGSEYQKKVIEKLLEFLIDNYNYLPMYANPMAVNLTLAGYEGSPMFSNI